VRRYFFRSKVTLNYPYHSEDLQHENRTRQNRSIQRDRREARLQRAPGKRPIGVRAITEQSFPGKWKIIYTYPKDFTFVCPTEIAGFAKLAKDFEDRDAVLLAGSTDNEFCKLGWRRDHKELSRHRRAGRSARHS
jgi:alkyl hydroperoxide reductase subunit AhpC